MPDYILHKGVKGMRWGVRKDGGPQGYPGEWTDGRKRKRQGKTDSDVESSKRVKKENSNSMVKTLSKDAGLYVTDEVKRENELLLTEGPDAAAIAYKKRADADAKNAQKQKLTKDIAIGIVAAGASVAAAYVAYRVVKNKSIDKEKMSLLKDPSRLRRLEEIKDDIIREKKLNAKYDRDRDLTGLNMLDAYNRYGNIFGDSIVEENLEDVDTVLDGDAIFHRLVPQGGDLYPTGEMEYEAIYMSHTDEDQHRYRQYFTNFATNQGRSNYKAAEFEFHIKGGLKAPSGKKRYETFAQLWNSNPNFKEQVLYDICGTRFDPNTILEAEKNGEITVAHVYRGFASGVTKRTKSSKMWLDVLSTQGYNAIIDDVDGGVIADMPLVYFGDRNNVSITNKLALDLRSVGVASVYSTPIKKGALIHVEGRRTRRSGMPLSNEKTSYIIHYGVQGTHWGVRKDGGPQGYPGEWTGGGWKAKKNQSGLSAGGHEAKVAKNRTKKTSSKKSKKGRGVRVLAALGGGYLGSRIGGGVGGLIGSRARYKDTLDQWVNANIGANIGGIAGGIAGTVGGYKLAKRAQNRKKKKKKN